MLTYFMLLGLLLYGESQIVLFFTIVLYLT